MKAATIAALVAAVAASLGLGYWWGARESHHAAASVEPAPAAERRILYYRHPMGLPDTSPVPKKDPMGMDYVPVYDGEEPAPSGPFVQISTERLQKLGVRTEAVSERALVRTVRAVATVQADERLLHTVAPRFEGWIETLYANTTGQYVHRGEPLMEVYSPDLVTAQHEYLIAAKGLAGVSGASAETRERMQQLVDSALARLRNWGIAETEIRTLQKEGTSRQHLALRSPVDGVVMDKPSVQGMRFMPGEMLYRIADLSSVWVLADVFEQDLGIVHPGQSARIRIDAYPDQAFSGTVTFVYPTIAAETRTATVRIELPNPDGRLKPDMFASTEFASSHGDTLTLAVPQSAVLDTGARQLVLVQRGEGRFEPREVKLGLRADGYVEVQDGVRAGEEVVVVANFLIDAESNLKAALGGFATHAHGGAPPAGPAQPGDPHTGHAQSPREPERDQHEGH